MKRADPKKDAENEEARYWEPDAVEYLDDSEINDEDLTRYKV